VCFSCVVLWLTVFASQIDINSLATHDWPAVNICERDVLMEMETDEKIVNVDGNYSDPQLCATIACDIYQHLRASEVQPFFLFYSNFLL